MLAEKIEKIDGVLTVAMIVDKDSEALRCAFVSTMAEMDETKNFCWVDEV